MATVEELKERLALAKRDLFCADMIDDTKRRDKEMTRCRARVEALETEMETALAYGYVRRTYNVDPVPGHRVSHHVTGRQGTICTPHAEDQYVHVRFDGDKHALRCHPMEIDFLGPSSKGACPGYHDPKVRSRSMIHVDDLRPEDDDPINLAGSGPVPIE